jgi:hypothetical protein
MKHNLNNEEFVLDEIIEIELIGEEDTIDISVEDTHMFYANGIYTHNSSISSEVVTTDQMGGSIQKAQVGHVVISIGKTMEQKEHNLATVTLLKSRIGKDGIVFQNCKFNNEYLDIDTETQNTLLGHEEDKAEKKRQRAVDVYNKDKIKEKTKIEKQIDEFKVDIFNDLVHKFESKESEVTDTSTIYDDILSTNDPPMEIKPVEEIKPTTEMKIISNNIINPSESVNTITQMSQSEKDRIKRIRELHNSKKIEEPEFNSG